MITYYILLIVARKKHGRHESNEEVRHLIINWKEKIK